MPSKPIRVQKALKDEISHWLFLRTWDDPLPWRDERHLRISSRWGQTTPQMGHEMSGFLVNF